jgi:riboflavin synthase
LFTGIIEDIGQVQSLQAKPGSALLCVRTSLEVATIAIGDSVAVNGACLTVTAVEDDRLTFDVSHETLAATTLHGLKDSEGVHLERALSLGGRLGGHLVTGHVDGVGKVLARSPQGPNLDLSIQVPGALSPYLVPKGSVAVDGVSLTVNKPERDRFSVTLVPHTLERTRLGERRAGEDLNLEADLLGKYVRHFMTRGAEKGIDRQFLAEHGFITPEE